MNIKRLENWATQIPNQSWFPLLALGIITVLAAGLRFYKLGEWSFWIDEIYTINHAQIHFKNLDLILQHIPPARNWIPVSVILTAQVLNVLGVSEWSARLVSVLIGIATIPVLYFPMKKVMGSYVALIALLLLAVSPWHIYWSQNARFYTSLLLFYSLALFAFYFCITYDQNRYILLFYCFLYLAFSERLFAIFIGPVITVYVISLWILRFKLPTGINLRNLVFFGLPVVVGGGIETANWVLNRESRFFGDFSWFFLYRNDDPVRLLGNISFYIGIPIIVFALISGIFLITKKSNIGLLLLINAGLPTMILVLANPYIFTKDRYVFFTLFSWVALAAFGLYELIKSAKGAHKWLAYGLLMIFILDASSDNLLYYKVNHGNRGEWNLAFTIVNEHSEMGDITVAYWTEFEPFYSTRQMIPYEDIDLTTIQRGSQNYWFIIDSETLWANPEVISFLEEKARLFDIRYLRTPDDFFLRIYEYNPNIDLVEEK